MVNPERPASGVSFPSSEIIFFRLGSNSLESFDVLFLAGVVLIGEIEKIDLF